MLLCWCNSLLGGTLVLLCFWSSEDGKNSIALVGTMAMSFVFVLRVWVLALEGCVWFVVIMSNMMVGMAPTTAAWVRARAGSMSNKETLSGSDSFFETKCPRLTKRAGCCAWPCHSFSWSDCVCNHPSSCRTFFCSPSLHNAIVSCEYASF